jgi:hypothetical protein
MRTTAHESTPATPAPARPLLTPDPGVRRASVVYRGSRLALTARRGAGQPRSHVVITIDAPRARRPLTLEVLTDDAALDDAVQTGLRIGRETVDEQSA